MTIKTATAKTATAKMATRSRFKRLAIPAALVVGGVTAGSLLAPVGLASAQDDDATTDPGSAATPPTDDGSADPGHRRGHGRGHLLGARGEVLEEVLGLDGEEIRAGLVDGGSLADLAEEQGVPVDELTDALVAAAIEHIDEAVTDGRLDADEAAARKADLEDRIAELITRSRPEGLEGGGHPRFGPPPGFDVAAEALGLSAEELRAGLDDGKTLADLAEEQGVSVDDLADAMVTAAVERLDQAVEDGKIDEDRAAELEEHLDDLIDRAIEAGPFALGRMEGRAEGRLADGARRGRGGGHHGAPGAGAGTPEGGVMAESGAAGGSAGPTGSDGAVEEASF